MRKAGTGGVRILIADDQADVREALVLLLKAEGYASVIPRAIARFRALWDEDTCVAGAQ